MSTPKFERSIQDTYTVTENNAVGAEDRGSVAESGSDEYTLSAWSGSISNLQELVDYCDTNSKDVANVNFDGESKEIGLTMPDYASSPGLVLQVSDGKSFKIILDDFVKARYRNSDITTDIDSGANKTDASDQYSPLVANEDDIYYIKDDGEWDTQVRGNITGKDYLAVCNDFRLLGGWVENALVDDSGTYKVYEGNTLRIASVSNVDTSDPRMLLLNDIQLDPSTFGSALFFQHTNNYQIQWYIGGASYPSTSRTDTIKQEDGSTFSDCEGWHIETSGKGSPRYTFSVAYGETDSIYTTYIYRYTNDFDAKIFDDDNIIKTIQVKLITIYGYITEEDTDSTSGRAYFGGRYIYHYDGNDDYDFTLEQTIPFDPTHAKFLKAGNTLYYIACSTDKDRVAIYKKYLTGSDDSWKLVKDVVDKPYIYLSHYYDSSNGLLRIIFKDTSDDTVYYFINRGIKIGAYDELLGFEIENNASFFDDNIENVDADTGYDSAVYSDNDWGRLSYCTVDAGNLHGLGFTRYMRNCILKTNKSGYYFPTFDTAVTASTQVTYSLIIAGEYGVLFDKRGSVYPEFSASRVINNCTIVAPNGMFIVAKTSVTPEVKNNIIDASVYAVIYNGPVDDLTIEYSIVNGSREDDVDFASTCIFDANPLFQDPTDDNYHLMSIAEGYPKDSVAIELGDDSKDAGCYDVSRTNDGETDKSTFTLTGYIIDIGLEWEYPKKETSFDYKGNFIKYMGERARVLQILRQDGNITLDIVGEMEYLISLEDALRFYPYGDDGLPYIIDESTSDTQDYTTSATLTYDHTDMTAEAPANHKFITGYLKGGWIEQTHYDDEELLDEQTSYTAGQVLTSEEWQSFRVSGGACEISKISVYSEGSPGDVTWTIYEGKGTSGTVVETGTINLSSAGWFDITMPAGVTASNGYYTFSMIKTSGDPAWGYDSTTSWMSSSLASGDFAIKIYRKPALYNYYYISENTDDTLYLENPEGYTTPTDGDYTSKLLWFYVKTADTIEYLNADWYRDNQIGLLPGVRLYVVNRKT